MHRWLLVGLLAVPLVAGCGSDDRASVPRADFEARLSERTGADADQASCIAGFVYDEYDEAAVQTIYHDGVDALPPSLWDAYFHSVIGCLVPAEAP